MKQLKAQKLVLVLLSIALLLPGFLSLGIITGAAKEVTAKVDGINSSRETGTLILYNSEFGLSTGTNPWGHEVTVDETGQVIKVGGNNSEIPVGGFVLSGHNAQTENEETEKKTFLMENVKLGDYILFSSNTMSILISDKPLEVDIYYKVERKVNGINSVRNADFLVIYDKAGTTTNTNQWGFEVIVEEGVVRVLGGNNNLVPTKSNSYVISGHGDSAKWLQNNIKLGMKVSFDSDTNMLTFEFDSESAADGVLMEIQTIEIDFANALSEYRYVDFKTIGEDIEELKNEFNEKLDAYKKDKDSLELDKACNKAQAKLDELSLILSESRTVEYRGVWIRPTQTSKEAVDAVVEDLYDNGINQIYIETLYGGFMIMPMPADSLFEQNPAWKGFDMLDAFIEACHKRDMELHIWMPVFYVGRPDNPKALGSKKPEWLAVHNKGSNYTSSSDGATYQFINHANTEATDYLLETYKYIFRNYNIDGFQLDYIRYFDRNSEYDYGYDDITLAAFEKKYGVRPEYDEKASYWEDWVAFRCQYVTNFVADVRKAVDELRPSILISAAVGANINSAYNNLYQDYLTWLEKGYLDILNPMAYGDGYAPHIKIQAEKCGDDVILGVGRSIQMPEFLARDMQRQAVEAYESGADYSAYFESSSYLKKGTGAVLTEGIYRNSAITPALDKSKAIEEALKYLQGRIDDVLLPLEAIDQSLADDIKDIITLMIEEVRDDKELDFASLYEKLDEITDENAKKAVYRDAGYAKKLYNLKKRVPNRIDVEKEKLPEVSDDSVVEDSILEDTSAGDQDRNNTLVWLIVAAAAVVLIAGIMISRKKKK